MADDILRAAIAALQTYESGVDTVTAGQIDIVIAAAQSTLSSAIVTASTWLVWSSFKSGSGWRKQVSPFDSLIDATAGARRMANAPDSYAYVTVTGPHTQQVPG